MKVTFLLAGVRTYGGDRVIARYALGLRDRGWEVTLISCAPPENTLFYRDLPIRDLGLPGFPSGRSQYFASVRRILKVAPNPGVVVATWTPTLPLAVVLRASGRAPRAIWLQQDFPEMFSGLRFERFLLRHGATFLDHTVGVSEVCGRIAGGPSARVTVLHSGLEEGFYREEGEVGSDLLQHPPDILFVGDPIPRKGWPELMEALEVLRQTGTAHRLLLVVRKTPTGPLPTGTRVILTPTDEELGSAYRNADLLVCASREEGWGLPALEAMASGTPVVSTLHQGCRAYARPGSNMVGVSVGDPDALALGIRKGLSDKKLRERLIRGGLETAERFRWRNSVTTFSRIVAGQWPQRVVEEEEL